MSEEDIRQMCSPDPASSIHLVVLNGSQDKRSIVGSGRILYQCGQKESELTLTVSDSWQRRGVGRRLLDHLIDASRQMGHAKIVARILTTIQPMLALVARRGFTISESLEGPGVKLAQLTL